MIANSHLQSRKKMEKQNKTTENASSHVMPEDLKLVGQTEKDILFFKFDKGREAYFRYIDKVKLEYDVYIVEELISKERYYLPAHNKIKEAFETYGNSRYYGIIYNETVKFDAGKRTYNSYDIKFYEVPTKG